MNVQNVKVLGYLMPPFDSTIFSHMATPLQNLLEIKFNLAYYLHLSFEDFNNTDMSELRWMNSRLHKKIEKQNEQRSPHPT